MMKLRQILCCAVLVLSASGMAQVSAGLHVPTRSEVGPQAMPKDMAISGLGKVFSTKCRNELSGKDIYVSVAAVDSVLAGKSSEVLRSWYAGAAEAVATSQYLAAEQKGMSQVFEDVKKSGVAAQAGLAAGQQAVLDALKAKQAEQNPVAPAAPAVVAPAPQPPAPAAPKKGVYVGGQNFSDDF